jgi:acetoin utilization deacetylase AcuC-like enzyme
MLPFKLVYHDGYDLKLGPHVFPSQKFRMIRDDLLARGLAGPEDFVTPALANDEDVLRVHSRGYVKKLKNGTLSYDEIARMEVPYSLALVDAVWLAAGGSILAGQLGLRDGYAANIGGGFHHAYPDHGEGFCVLHDVAIAIRRLQYDGAIERAMVVDTDVHQGNGTAAIFAHDETVFTFSIHQENNYPHPKPPSTLDVNLRDGVGDDEYLAILDENLHQAFQDFAPQIVFYIAGADPYREDQLGGLRLTMEGLRKRDDLVFDYAQRYRAPAVITMAGGYARDVCDTVRIQAETILAARDAYAKSAAPTESPS